MSDLAIACIWIREGSAGYHLGMSKSDKAAAPLLTGFETDERVPPRGRASAVHGREEPNKEGSHWLRTGTSPIPPKRGRTTLAR